jgi:hypothetical protein
MECLAVHITFCSNGHERWMDGCKTQTDRQMQEMDGQKKDMRQIKNQIQNAQMDARDTDGMDAS